MARKRRIEVEKVEEQEEIEEIPRKFRDSTWSEWARGTYAKWWYGLLCISIDLFIALEIAQHLSQPWSYFLPIILVVVMVILELYIYHRLWGGLELLFGGTRFL